MKKPHSWITKITPFVISSILILPASQTLADTSNSTTDIYQSAFDDYKADAKQKPTEWTEANKPSGSSGHEGHNMKDMAADDMQVDHSNMSDMSGMDHSSMKGMDHSNMKDMDHSKMSETDHSSMKDMDHSKMQGMDHSKMSGMALSNMKDMDHTHMAGMDHSQMGKEPSAPSGKQENKEPMEMAGHGGTHDHSQHAHSEMAAPEANESEPHQHQHDSMTDMNAASTNASEEHGGHSHGSAVTNSQTENSGNQPAGFEIIPNLHPAVVHFPIALTLVAFMIGLSAFVVRRLPIADHADGVPMSEHIDAAVHFSLWLAALGALVAVVFGWLAFNSANHDEAGHLAMLTHRAWAIPTAIGLVLVAGWDMVKNGYKKAVSPLLLSLLFLLSVSISATAWLGGEVVYRHGIGVLSIPATQGAGHSHQHGAEGKGSQHDH